MTLSATTTLTTATVAITDDNDTTSANEAEFGLDEGANGLEVVVTAEDGSTETYTITVAREAAAPTADPDAIWTANLTVGIGDDGTDPLVGYLFTVGTTWGAITPARFDIDSKTLLVHAFQYDVGDNLRFAIAGIDPGAQLGDADYVLHVGNKSFFIESPGNVTSLTFADAGFTWTYGQVVPVKLVTADATSDGIMSGAAQVGRTLSADTSTIEDANGLTSPTYALQWNRVDQDGSSNPVDLGTGTTYTLGADDLAKRIKLTITFEDDDSNPEELTHTTNVVVPGAVENCTTPTDNLWCTTLTVGYQTAEYIPEEDLYDFRLGYAVDYGGDEDFGALGTNTFTYLGVEYTVTGVTANPHNRELYIATTPELPRGGVGLTLHLQQITGNELELPLSEADLELHALLEGGAWNFGFVLVKTNGNPHVPLLRGSAAPNAPYENYTDEGTKFGIRLTSSFNATGAPTITGTAQTGETLTAHTIGIGDPDGLTSPTTYSYQWIRVDADGTSNPNDITGATSDTYTLTAADTGRKIRVRVTFTDDAGNTEELTSAAYPSGSGTVATGIQVVPADWSLIPAGLGPGDSFRLLYLTSTMSAVTSLDISDYNTIVQDLAANGHTGVQGYSNRFKVVGSTAGVDARDNTGTTYTTFDKGVPIYWLNGNKVADDYEDFYDGDWDDEANDKNESGTDGPDTSDSDNYPATGSNHDGTESFSTLSASRALGAASVRLGVPNSSGAGHGPLSSGISGTGNSLLYALSDVMTVKVADRQVLLQRTNANGTLNDSTTVAGKFFIRIFISPSATGLVEDDLDITNGTIDRFRARTVTIGGNVFNVWYVDIIPDLGVSTVTVRVPPDVVDGGNPSAEVTYDADPPLLVTLTTNASEPVVDNFVVTATFSEAVKDFSDLANEEGDINYVFIPAEDLNIRRGSYVRYRLPADRKTWRITINPNSNPGTTVVSLPQGEVATGAATNVWNYAARFEIESGVRSVSFEQATFAVDEADDITIKVVLDADPLNTVVIPLTTTGQGGATTPEDYSGIPASVTFNAGETEQSFTISAAHDLIDDDGESVEIAIGTSLPDIIQAGTTASTTVSIADDDTAGVTVPAGLTVVEGESEDYAVVLESEPTANVTLTMGGLSGTDVTTNPSTLTFTSGNWDTEESVSVSAAQDTDDDDDEATITHTASSSDTNYSGITVNSLVVSVNDDDSPGEPTISGTAEVRSTLTASTTDVTDPHGVTNAVYTYQWIRVDADGTSNPTPITGATSSTYQLMEDDGDHKVKVKITFNDDDANPEERTSTAYPSVGTVAPLVNIPAEGPPTISGTAQAGNTLAASTSGITDDDGLTTPVTYAYQWIQADADGANPTPISGATSMTYTLTSALVGRKVMVKVDFKDDLDNLETLTSDPYPTSGTVTGNNQTPELSIPAAQADEGEDIVFTTSSDKTATHDITVDYATRIRSGDTAEQSDFIAESGTVTILAGQTEATFTVATADKQNQYAGDETFTVTISNPTGATVGNANAQGTIRETDPLPQLSFDSYQFIRDENNSQSYNINVNIAPKAENSFDFHLDKSGSAEDSEDYTSVGDTFTVTANQSQYGIPISAIDDNIFEGEESAVFTIRANPALYRIEPGRGTYKFIIIDDEPAPQFAATAYRAGTEGGQNQGTEYVSGQDYANVVFKLELDRAISLPITVNVEAIDGTAVRGQDYRMDTTEVTFSGGQQVKYVKAAVIDDSDFEGGRNETFQLKVTSGSHNIPGTDVYLTGLIRDNEAPPEGVDYIGGDKDTTGAIAVGESWINDMPILGRIEEEEDQDWYSTELQAGRCYQIDIWGKEMYEHFNDNPDVYVAPLTLVDPALIGIYKEDGTYLPGSTNYDGWLASTTRHTISVSRSGTYFLAARYDRGLDGGTFWISLYDMGAPIGQHCTKLDVDNLTYEPGYFADK